jgi:acid stress chaperone HdeA
MKATAPVAMVIFALLFSGCSPSAVINTGGDTKCKDFVTQDEKKQGDEVAKMLKDRSGGAEPASLQVTGTRVAVQSWCQTLGTPDSKISEMPHL